jgi:hypothetical protein
MTELLLDKECVHLNKDYNLSLFILMQDLEPDRIKEFSVSQQVSYVPRNNF